MSSAHRPVKQPVQAAGKSPPEGWEVALAAPRRGAHGPSELLYVQIEQAICWQSARWRS